MPLHNIGAGSVATADVRSALTANATLPTQPHFLLRASHAVPVALATLALDFERLILEWEYKDNGWIAVPIERPLQVGQRLVWTALVNAQVGRIAAYLIFNQKLKYLRHRDGLSTGEAWTPGPVVLRPVHLS